MSRVYCQIGLVYCGDLCFPRIIAAAVGGYAVGSLLFVFRFLQMSVNRSLASILFYLLLLLLLLLSIIIIMIIYYYYYNYFYYYCYYFGCYDTFG